MSDQEKSQVSEVAAVDPIYSMRPKHVWLRIGNCESNRKRFQIILEIDGGERSGGVDRVIYDAVNECDGNISHHHNLSWLVRDNPSPTSGGGLTVQANEKEIRNALGLALGHSNCYCDSCQDLARRYWSPEIADLRKKPLPNPELAVQPVIKEEISKFEQDLDIYERHLQDEYQLGPEAAMDIFLYRSGRDLVAELKKKLALTLTDEGEEKP